MAASGKRPVQSSSPRPASVIQVIDVVGPRSFLRQLPVGGKESVIDCLPSNL